MNVADIFDGVLKGKRNPKIKLLGDSITHGAGGTNWDQNGDVIIEGWAESPNGFSWANPVGEQLCCLAAAPAF